MERERTGLLNDVAGIPAELLERTPGQGAWSIAQTVVHLAMAEEGTLAYLHKKLAYGGHRTVTITGVLRLVILRIALALPIRWKAPRSIAVIPEMPWEEALARWDVVRGEWHRALEELPMGLVHHGLIKHPAVGKLSVAQGLHFMARHVRHHREQVRRTLRQIGDGTHVP